MTEQEIQLLEELDRLRVVYRDQFGESPDTLARGGKPAKEEMIRKLRVAIDTGVKLPDGVPEDPDEMT